MAVSTKLVGNVILHTKKKKKTPASSARLCLFVFAAVQNHSTLVSNTSMDNGVHFGDADHDHLADFSALLCAQRAWASSIKNILSIYSLEKKMFLQFS